MISLGGTIGTGLFLASGASIANAGPGGALIAYSLIGVMVFFMMECLGEMVMKSILNFRSEKKFSRKPRSHLNYFFRPHIFPFRAVSITMLVGLSTQLLDLL